MSLLILDLQNGFLNRLPETLAKSIVDNTLVASSHLDTILVRVALTAKQIQETPDRVIFNAFRENPAMAASVDPDSEAAQPHAKLAKLGPLYTKIRPGAFVTGAVDSKILKKQVFIAGMATSGAVLFAVTQLADLDYDLYILEDCCVDPDEEIHKVLMEKFFPKHTKVIKSSDVEGILAKNAAK